MTVKIKFLCGIDVWSGDKLSNFEFGDVVPLSEDPSKLQVFPDPLNNSVNLFTCVFNLQNVRYCCRIKFIQSPILVFQRRSWVTAMIFVASCQVTVYRMNFFFLFT